MDFDIYCDESSLEALTKTEEHLYSSIGGIWLPRDCREEFKKGIYNIKAQHKIFGELKWKKISPSYFELYKDLIDFFFRTDYIRFRIILIESSKVNHIKFNNTDAELGFYKFYYQLLHHWILDFNTYNIFVDLKVNSHPHRLAELRKVLDLSNLTSDISQVQGLHSEESVGIQLADVLTGLVTSKFNNEVKRDSVKAKLIHYIENEYLGKEISPTPKWSEKFNIFKINLQGGW
mgnify:CR=1 FL=1